MNLNDLSLSQRDCNSLGGQLGAMQREFAGASNKNSSQSWMQPISHDIGEIFEISPIGVRIKMLEYLLRNIGVLPLVAVANGIFAKIVFRGSWPELRIKEEDVVEVKVGDVISLADYVLQVNDRVVFELKKLLLGEQRFEDSEEVAKSLKNLSEPFCRCPRCRRDDLDSVMH